MDTFIPRYRYKFKEELPHGDKRYILTYGGIFLADIAEQINKRRTFAIISHPDAGKTTLTEKLLL